MAVSEQAAIPFCMEAAKQRLLLVGLGCLLGCVSVIGRAAELNLCAGAHRAPLLPDTTSQDIARAAGEERNAFLQYSASGDSRPRIGLLLSGGGARGFAHIGLLKQLEDNGIRPDYIAGTSMGALLGALYAMGYTADQIERLAREANWFHLLSNEEPLEEVAIDLKPNVGRSQLSMVWRDGQFRLPRGAIESQSLWILFQQLVWPAARVHNFDSLTIPFRCCAVDLKKGELVVLSGGSLPVAMRASMAIPGVFTPVPVGDSSLLVDGGVLDNFPYQTLREMGADVVIGSYTGPKSLAQREDYGVRDLLTQATMIAGVRQAMADMQKCDILVFPELDGYTSMDFRETSAIIAKGHEAALQKVPELRALAERLYGSSSPLHLPPLNLQAKQWVQSLKVEGVDSTMGVFFAQRMEIKTPDSVDAEEVGQSLNRLYSTQFLRRASLYLTPSGQLRVATSAKEQVSLQFGLNFNDFWGAGLVARLMVLNPLFGISRWNVDAEIATQPRIRFSHTQYLSSQMRTLLSLSAYYSSSIIPLYQGFQRVAALWEHQFIGELALGRIARTSALFEAGVGYQFNWQIPNAAYVRWLGVESPVRVATHEVNAFARVTLNTLDRHYYPRHGHKLYARVGYQLFNSISTDPQERGTVTSAEIKDEFGQSPQVFTGNVSYTSYFRLARPLVLSVSVGGGVFTSRRGRLGGFRLGGQPELQRDAVFDAPFYGIGYRQLAVNNYALGRVDLRFRIWREFYLTARGNYAVHSVLPEHLYQSFTTPRQSLLGGAFSVGWLTHLGLMEATVAASTESKTVWAYFNLGIPF